MIRLKLKNKYYKINLLTFWFNNRFIIKYKNTTKKKWRFFKYKNYNLKRNTFQRFKTIKYLKNCYNERLKTKKTIKYLYGNLTEKQFYTLYSQNEKIIQLFIRLESKLNIILFRVACTNSIIQANKLISLGNIKVNNKIIKHLNYILQPGDIVSMHNIPIMPTEKSTIKYIEKNIKLNSFCFLRKPFFKEIPFKSKLNLFYCSEFYKK